MSVSSRHKDVNVNKDFQTTRDLKTAKNHSVKNGLYYP